MNSILWIIVLAILILIEILTLGITTIWFAGGALAAFIVSLFFDNLILEIILFFAVSFALLYFTRPIVLRYFRSGEAKTGYEGVIGKEATVLEDIDNTSGTGKVDVDGQEWSARSLEGEILENGCKVVIRGITGAKLIVVRAQSN